MKRMTRDEVDRLAGQTPCLCGNIDTWHPECYRGKTAAQVQQARIDSYKIAEKKLLDRLASATTAAIENAKERP
jgi:hypothetical protein